MIETRARGCQGRDLGAPRRPALTKRRRARQTRKRRTRHNSGGGEWAGARMFGRNKTAGPSFGHVTVEDDRDIEVQRVDDEARKHFWSEARLLLRDLVF